MKNNENVDSIPAEIPVDALVIKQSSWAWRWAAIPWGVLIVLFLWMGAADATSIPLPIILAVAICVPRYIGWRRTSFILTRTHLILNRGNVFGTQRYDFVLSQMANVGIRNGMFGGSLGYHAVDILFHNEPGEQQSRLSLAYVPAASNLASLLQESIRFSGKEQ